MEIVGGKAESVNLEEFLSRPLFAHLATSSKGGPCDTPVWFLWEGGALWIIAVVAENTFHERIDHDPRCAIGVVDFDVGSGLVQHVGFRGRATVEAWDAERAKRLFSKYLSGDRSNWDRRRFVEGIEDSSLWRFVKFTPETATVRDQSYPVL